MIMKNEPVLHPKTLDEAIQDAVYWILHMDKGAVAEITRACWRAKAEALKTTPRNEQKLAALIEDKKRELRALQIAGEPAAEAIIMSELEALNQMVHFVDKYGV